MEYVIVDVEWVFGAWFAAAAPIIGSVIAGLFGRKGAKDQNEAQVASAREQMAFQERMSGTAHQREIEDLRKAGLNPILSATGGAGSSTPSGAQANIVNEMAPAVSSALAVRELGQRLKNLEQDRQLSIEQMYKTEQENLTSRANAKLIEATEARTRVQTEMDKSVLSGLRIESEIDRTKIGEITRYLNRIFGSGSSAQGIMRMIPGSGVLRR